MSETRPVSYDTVSGLQFAVDGAWQNIPDTTGISQLTGGVTAGPGSGSQAATVVSVGGQSAANVAGAVTKANNAVLGKGTVGSIAGTGTVTPDASVASTFTMTVSGAVTLNGPANPTDGQKVLFVITNDASHAVSLATGAGNFAFGTDIPSYTNSVSKIDLLGAIYNAVVGKWLVASLNQGF